MGFPNNICTFNNLSKSILHFSNDLILFFLFPSLGRLLVRWTGVNLVTAIIRLHMFSNILEILAKKTQVPRYIETWLVLPNREITVTCVSSVCVLLLYLLL